MRYEREFIKQLDKMEQQSYALYLLKDRYSIMEEHIRRRYVWLREQGKTEEAEKYKSVVSLLKKVRDDLEKAYDGTYLEELREDR